MLTGPSRVSIDDIRKDLGVGKPAVYRMLGERVIPSIRVGQKFIVTRAAYEAWKKTCGTGIQLQHGNTQA